jgi:hypothetical protein
MSDNKRVEAWWTLTGDDKATAVRMTIESIRETQFAMRENDMRHLRMYRNMALAGMGITTGARSAAGATPLSLNITRNMVNAVTSKICKHNPKGTFQTFGAGYKTRRQMREMEQFARGMLYKERLRVWVKETMRNIGILGTGVIKVCPLGGGRICMENVFTPEITVDSAEGMHRTPKNWYQSKYVDKTWLASQQKDEKLKARVMELSSLRTELDEPEQEFFYLSREQDMVRLDEAYHLSNPGEKDGYFAQSVQGILLGEKPWKWDFAPYAIGRWSESPLGFFGMGLAEELVGIQVEINRIVRKIQTSFQLLANPYVLADRSSNIARSSITDIPGSVILYNGREPRVYAPSTVSAEVFSHLDRLYQRAYELAGISQMTAQSQKPVGFESGRAILVFEDIESDRFATMSQEWDNLHMRVIELGLWAAEEEHGYWVPAKKKLGIEKAKYSDVGIRRNDVMVEIAATSILGDTPSGQIDMLEKIVSRGIGTPMDWADQILDPDAKAILDRAAVPKRIVERYVEDMLDGGDYRPPDPAMDLEVAMSTAQAMYIEALELGDHTPEQLRNVRKFMNAIGSLVMISQQKAQLNAPPEPHAPQLPPGGGGMPPGTGMPQQAAPQGMLQ